MMDMVRTWRARVRMDGVYRGQAFTLKRDAIACARRLTYPTRCCWMFSVPIPDRPRPPSLQAPGVYQIGEVQLPACAIGTVRMAAMTIEAFKLKYVSMKVTC